MADRILVLERDRQDPAVWRYGLVDEHGQLPAGALQLRYDQATGCVPIGECAEMLWPTVILLVRQAGDRDRIVYDLQPWLRDAPREPPPRPPEKPWERATSGKSKGTGATLQERAERARDGRPRAAA